MSAVPRSRYVAAALAVPVALALASCSDGDKDKAKEAAGAACPSTITQTASTPLPGDVPAPSGGAVYDYNSQGKTRFWFVAVDGTPDQLVSLRDGYNSQLTGRGYTIEGHDQEPGAEAESEFKGPHEGTTQFQPLCSGKVRVRIKLTS
jgi:hypothetical protein